MIFYLHYYVPPANGFQIHRYGDNGYIFKVTGGHYVSKLTFFMQYFIQVFSNGFQILGYGDHGTDLEMINFS